MSRWTPRGHFISEMDNFKKNLHETRPTLDSADANSSGTVEDLLDPMDWALVSSKRSMVPLEGLEPPTVSLGRNCSSIELQRLAASSLGGVAGSARPSGPERGNPLGMALVRLRASPTLGIVAGPKTATEGELPCSP